MSGHLWIQFQRRGSRPPPGGGGGLGSLWVRFYGGQKAPALRPTSLERRIASPGVCKASVRSITGLGGRRLRGRRTLRTPPPRQNRGEGPGPARWAVEIIGSKRW